MAKNGRPPASLDEWLDWKERLASQKASGLGTLSDKPSDTLRSPVTWFHLMADRGPLGYRHFTPSSGRTSPVCERLKTNQKGKHRRYTLSTIVQSARFGLRGLTAFDLRMT
jgi:hypothetical protein